MEKFWYGNLDVAFAMETVTNMSLSRLVCPIAFKSPSTRFVTCFVPWPPWLQIEGKYRFQKAVNWIKC